MQLIVSTAYKASSRLVLSAIQYSVYIYIYNVELHLDDVTVYCIETHKYNREKLPPLLQSLHIRKHADGNNRKSFLFSRFLFLMDGTRRLRRSTTADLCVLLNNAPLNVSYSRTIIFSNNNNNTFRRCH